MIALKDLKSITAEQFISALENISMGFEKSYDDLTYKILNNIGIDKSENRKLAEKALKKYKRLDLLGPKQQEWVMTLLTYPELQLEGQLGLVDEDKNLLGACCLGIMEILDKNKDIDILCFQECKNDESTYDLVTIKKDSGLPEKDVTKRVGLLTVDGEFINAKELHNSYTRLTEMNDDGKSWIDIVDIILRNPKNVFKTKK